MAVPVLTPELNPSSHLEEYRPRLIGQSGHFSIEKMLLPRPLTFMKTRSVACLCENVQMCKYMNE